MRASFYAAAILLSWETRLRAFAKPLATAEENLFTSLDDGGEDSLFASLDDGNSAAIGGDDMIFVTTGLDDSNLLIANDEGGASSCSSEVGLGDSVDDETLALGNSDDFLTSRDLDDNTIFADTEQKTCTAPGARPRRKKEPDRHLPGVPEWVITDYDTGKDCHADHPDRLCCGIAGGPSPRDCDPWPIYLNCIHPRLEYCCVTFDVIKRQGKSCVLAPGEWARVLPPLGGGATWDLMPITPPDAPREWRPPGQK